jgi:hypothetical protein
MKSGLAHNSKILRILRTSYIRMDKEAEVHGKEVSHVSLDICHIYHLCLVHYQVHERGYILCEGSSSTSFQDSGNCIRCGWHSPQ